MTATANISNTRVVPTATTVLPYYDDFAEDKKFHRILFRPGYPVQARELTQLQTISQNQIERFGNHIFKNGSIVLGGQTTLDADALYINLVSTYANTDIVASQFRANSVTFASGNAKVIAHVFSSAEATATEPATLVIKYLSGEEFPNNTTIKSNTNVYANVASGIHTGSSTIVSIDDGIFYINGYFVKVPSQTVIVNKYSPYANAKVGLEFSEEIVDENSDSSLLDPAQEASNYQAPGAARLKINFDLAVRSLDSTDTDNFIEMLRIKEGVVTKKIVYPIYSQIGDTLARRTSDESGDYTVRRFRTTVIDHPTDNTKVQLVIDPGKAYVKGYEFESIYQEKIDIAKSRANTAVNSKDITINYGNNLYVGDLRGYLDSSTMQNVQLHNALSNQTDINTYIGSGRIRDIKYYSAANTDNLSTAIYTVSLFDMSFNGANSIVTANSISTSTGNANISFSLSKSNGLANGSTYLTDTNFNLLVFPIGDEFIVPASISDQDFQYSKVADITFAAGSATITSATGETFVGVSDSTGRSSSTLSNFMVFRTNGIPVDIDSVTVTEPTATLTSATFTSGTAKVIYQVYANSGASVQPRTKTKNLANTTHFVGGTANNIIITGTANTSLYGGVGQAVIKNPSNDPAVKMSLFYADVHEIKKIYNLNGAAFPTAGLDLSVYADVTDKYNFDTGQRDTHYDHGSISLAPRNGAVTGPLVVCFDWFGHTGTGAYFSVDSYSTIDYSTIPTYIATDGEEYSLRDSIDLRPTLNNASNTRPDYSFNTTTKLPKTGTAFEADYNYYLAKQGLLSIDPNASQPFRIIEGASSKNPIEPKPDNNSMVIYKYYVEPYTMDSSNVFLEFVENKRYTMRDIGKLDRRIENLEYYQTLTTLELSATDMSILDENGLERTKYGILADNFTGHGYGDVDDPDYFVAMDRVYGGMVPAANTVLMSMVYGSSTNVANSNFIATLSYTEEEFIVQDKATKWVNVQPYMMAQWVGDVVLSPEADNWQEINQTPDVIINLGQNDALQATGRITRTIRSTTTTVNTVTTSSVRIVSRGRRRRRRNVFSTEAFFWSTWFGSIR